MDIKRANKNLDELLSPSEGNTPVYIINTSRDRSTLLINFVIPGTGKVETHIIHGSWIPQRIFPDRPREVLLNNMNLRSYLGLGVITLVDSEWAQKMLETDDAIHEHSRLNQSKHSIFSKKNIEAQIKQPLIHKSFENQASSFEEEVIEDPVNDRVKDLVAQFDEGNIEIRTFTSELRNLSGLLTEHDYSWILQNATANSLKDLAKKALSKSEAPA